MVMFDGDPEFGGDHTWPAKHGRAQLKMIQLATAHY